MEIMDESLLGAHLGNGTSPSKWAPQVVTLWPQSPRRSKLYYVNVCFNLCICIFLHLYMYVLRVLCSIMEAWISYATNSIYNYIIQKIKYHYILYCPVSVSLYPYP